MEGSIEQNNPGYPLNSYPISTSENSNPSKTPPQVYQSHPCQFPESQNQVMIPSSMSTMHYNQHYPISVRHNMSVANMNPESCHYGFQGIHSASAIPQMQSVGNPHFVMHSDRGPHPAEMMHVLPSNAAGGYHFNQGYGAPSHVMTANGPIPTHHPQGPQQMNPMMNPSGPIHHSIESGVIGLCPVCQKEVLIGNVNNRGNNNQQSQNNSIGNAIQCNYSCGNWYHRMCSGLSVEAFQMLRANENFVEWICKSCEASTTRIWFIKPRPPNFVNKFIY